MRASLVERFTEYLRAGAPAGQGAEALAAELRANGLALEGRLIERTGWTPGVDGAVPWSGRRTFVGRTPPADAALGELWLDTVEVVGMVLVEEPARRQGAGPTRAWFALRPVARWQFRSFVACAPIVSREVQLAPTREPFASAREAQGDDTAAMTDLTFGEATLYANWFGKGTPNRFEWQGPARTLGDAFAALWTPGLSEWGGYGANEEQRIRLAADTWDQNPYGRGRDDDDDGDGDGDGGMVTEEYEHFADTGFRTIAGVDPRALAAAPDRLPTMEPIALTGVFAR